MDGAGRTEQDVAAAGIDALEAWARDIGCVMRLSELGVTEGMLGGIVEATFPMEGGYHPLTKTETKRVLTESL